MMIDTMDAVAVTADQVVERLTDSGYAIVSGLMSPEQVDEARADLRRVLDRTPTGRNSFEGFATQRVYALFAKTRTFDQAAVHPLLLGVLDRLLGHYQLSAPVGIQIGPGEKAQVLHRDEGVYPLPRPHPPVVLNTMWPLDPFTEENGATRLVPGSHRWDPERVPREHDAVVCASMEPGSAMFYLGDLWHGGGANKTERPRLGVILEYVVAWLRPQENHCLAVPRRVARELSEPLQELLGYNIYPPFLGYVDGSHPRKVLQRDD
jgi:ectoine hydroxylase-related dioxygenase (phytanoyl-CoA dioxygenase family)